MPLTAAGSVRRKSAVESFGNAALTIGECRAGMALFAITRGQWSMIDAILHVLDQVGRAKLTLWTWTVADYEVQVLRRLRLDSRITDGVLIIDAGARVKNAEIIKDWKTTFGPTSVRYVLNHAKLATVESESGLKFLLRGSMNLNFNPRFEQFDITEGGADFDLIKQTESELSVLPDNCSGDLVYKNSRVSGAFDKSQLELFQGCKIWNK
jgi:hypothetical protein